MYQLLIMLLIILISIDITGIKIFIDIFAILCILLNIHNCIHMITIIYDDGNHIIKNNYMITNNIYNHDRTVIICVYTLIIIIVNTIVII